MKSTEYKNVHEAFQMGLGMGFAGGVLATLIAYALYYGLSR